MCKVDSCRVARGGKSHRSFRLDQHKWVGEATLSTWRLGSYLPPMSGQGGRAQSKACTPSAQRTRQTTGALRRQGGQRFRLVCFPYPTPCPPSLSRRARYLRLYFYRTHQPAVEHPRWRACVDSPPLQCLSVPDLPPVYSSTTVNSKAWDDAPSTLSSYNPLLPPHWRSTPPYPFLYLHSRIGIGPQKAGMGSQPRAPRQYSRLLNDGAVYRASSNYINISIWLVTL